MAQSRISPVTSLDMNTCFRPLFGHAQLVNTILFPVGSCGMIVYFLSPSLRQIASIVSLNPQVSRFVSILLFSSFVFFCFNAQSQTTSDDLKKIRLNGLYDGAFADVLERISQEHAVKFSYNRVLLEKRNVQDFPDNLPLNQFLDYWCGLFDLRYYVSDGVIHIVGKESHKKRSNTIGHLELTVEATFTLSGKVTDKRTSKPLPYASIAIKGTRQVTRTNANGLFVLKGIRSDVVRLVVTRQGYDSETMRVSLSSDRNFLTIEMTDYSRQLRALMEKVHSRK